MLLTQFHWTIFCKKHCLYHMPRNGRSEICLTPNWCSLGLLLWKTGFLAGREAQQPGRSRGRPGSGGVTCFPSRLGWRQVGCWAGYEGGSRRESLHFMSWGEVGGKSGESWWGEDGRNGLKTGSKSVSGAKGARWILECKCNVKHPLVCFLLSSSKSHARKLLWSCSAQKSLQAEQTNFSCFWDM